MTKTKPNLIILAARVIGAAALVAIVFVNFNLLFQDEGSSISLSTSPLESYAQGSESNQWNTGQGWYQITVHNSVGATMTDVSHDGGATWSLNLSIFGSGFTIGHPTGSGNDLTRVITFTATYDSICCSPGSTGRCDYPAC